MPINYDRHWRENNSSCNCDRDRRTDRRDDRRDDRRNDRRDDRRNDRNDYWPWR